MKKFKILLIGVVCLFFLFSGCALLKNYNVEFDKLQKETDSRYSFVGNRGITIDGTYFDYEESAVRYVPKSEYYYVGNLHYGENKVFFTYHYRTPYTDSIGGNPTSKTYGIGLFSMDYYSGECELIQDFKEIYQVGWSAYPSIVHSVTQDRYAVLFYNGILEIRDLETNNILFSQAFYQADAYYQDSSVPSFSILPPKYKFFDNDFVYIEHDSLYFFEYQTTAYQLKTFTNPKINSDDYVAMSGNVLYTRQSQSIVYCYAVDVMSGEDVSVDDLPSIIAAETQQAEQPTISFGGKEYTASVISDGIVLTETGEGEEIVLDSSFFENNNAVYNKILEIYNDANLAYFQPALIKQQDNKILVGCQGEIPAYFPIATPVFMFEFDMSDMSLLYVGYTLPQNLLAKIVVL